MSFNNYTKIFIFIIILIGLILLSVKLLGNQKKDNYVNFKNKLNIVIPLRDREPQLEEIVKRFDEILNFQNIDYRIYIIEQSEHKLFNRGKY